MRPVFHSLWLWSNVFLKRSVLLACSFKERKSLLRFGSILSLIFICFYCIIIFILILIRKKFTSLDCCSIYLNALTLRLFISRKKYIIHWRTLLKCFTSLALTIVFNSFFHCQTASWNIISRFLCNQFRLETVNNVCVCSILYPGIRYNNFNILIISGEMRGIKLYANLGYVY